MNTFAQADTNNTGAIEKPEWDALLLDDKRRRIEDDDAHRDQIRKMLWEIFTVNEIEAKQLPNEKFSCEDLVEKIEDEIHESTGSDAKSR